MPAASRSSRREPVALVRARSAPPSMTGGGIVHGPHPRDYSQRTPKKMIAAALLGALSDRARGEPPARGRVLRARRPHRPRTPSALLGRRRDEQARADRARARRRRSRSRACATSKHVHVLDADQLNAYDVLVSDDIVFTKAAFEAFVACEELEDHDRRRPAMSGRQQGPARRHPRAGRLREELRPDRRRQVHLRGRPALQQDRDQARDREDLRASRSRRSTR